MYNTGKKKIRGRGGARDQDRGKQNEVEEKKKQLTTNLFHHFIPSLHVRKARRREKLRET